MKLLPSFRFGRLITLAVFLSPVAAFAQFVTVNFSAGDLRNSSGIDLSTGTVVLLVADTSGHGFGSLTPGSSLTAGSFLNSGDQIIGTTMVLDGDSGVIMGTTGSIQLMTGTYANLNTGDPLALIWLPGVTSTSTTLNAGQSYGLYSGTPSESDSADWVVPASSSTVQLKFLTVDEGNFGTPDSDANAAFSVSAVPEPADFSLIAGAVGCLVAMGQRYRSRKSRPLAS